MLSAMVAEVKSVLVFESGCRLVLEVVVDDYLFAVIKLAGQAAELRLRALEEPHYGVSRAISRSVSLNLHHLSLPNTDMRRLRRIAHLLLCYSCSGSMAMAFVVDIVTGASQGIGKAIGESIAHRRKEQFSVDSATPATSPQQYRLILVGRNAERGNQVATALQRETGLSVTFESCDVSDFSSVMDLRRRILSTDDDNEHSDDEDAAVTRVGILVNNAAECPQQQQFVERPRKTSTTTTLEKVDKQFATNVLGYHFMLTAFSSAFTDETRVVNVASNWAGDLDLNDVHFQRRRRYDNDSAYRQSKQCDRMLSVGWANRLAGGGNNGTLKACKVNACHPGDPCTVLSRALGYNMYASAPTRSFIDQSGLIPSLCGLGKSDVPRSNGAWYDGSLRPQTERFASNVKNIDALMDLCDSFCVVE